MQINKLRMLQVSDILIDNFLARLKERFSYEILLAKPARLFNDYSDNNTINIFIPRIQKYD